MIQCDVCDRWVHATCDGIDDVAYLAFGTEDIYYECPECRGEIQPKHLFVSKEEAPPKLDPVPPPIMKECLKSTVEVSPQVSPKVSPIHAPMASFEVSLTLSPTLQRQNPMFVPKAERFPATLASPFLSSSMPTNLYGTMMSNHHDTVHSPFVQNCAPVLGLGQANAQRSRPLSPITQSLTVTTLATGPLAASDSLTSAPFVSTPLPSLSQPLSRFPISNLLCQPGSPFRMEYSPIRLSGRSSPVILKEQGGSPHFSPHRESTPSPPTTPTKGYKVDKSNPPTIKEVTQDVVKASLSSEKQERATEDPRLCQFCHKRGDSLGEGRLLPSEIDTWVHSNCALWSAECYETVEGGLVNVSKAIVRGRSIVRVTSSHSH